MSKLNSTQWTNYWQESTYINSFGVDNYDNDVAIFWREQLYGQGYTSLLDLACGNGAISWLANDILNKEQNRTAITGIDFSNINPFEQLNRNPADYPMLSFLGNTKLESLPFADNTQDAAISQYGIEYSNLRDSIAELSRVLKPTGKIHFIVHSQDSEIVQQSMHSLKQYEIILKEVQLHIELLAINRIIGTETDLTKLRANPAFIAQSEVIQKKMFLIDNVIRTGKSVQALLNYKLRLMECVSEEAIKKSPDIRAASIDSARKSLAAYISRIKDLAKIALTEQGIKELTAQLENHKFTITRLEIFKHDDLNNAGRIIIAERHE